MLYGKKQKQENITTVFNQVLFDQRAKILIEKHIAFSVENSLLWIRSTLVAIQVATKLVLSIIKFPLFTDVASTILSEQSYNDKKENFNDEKLRIITAIVNLITNEERCMQYENNVYPSNAGKELVAEFLSPNDSFSRTRFKTNIIKPMYFKSNVIKKCYTSFII